MPDLNFFAHLVYLPVCSVHMLAILVHNEILKALIVLAIV